MAPYVVFRGTNFLLVCSPLKGEVHLLGAYSILFEEGKEKNGIP